MDPFPPTQQQLAVINHRGSNLLVLAGPGTGKTETLARRFASLVADGVAPNQILVLTFSRRAADEMRDRVLLRLRQVRPAGLAVSELFVKTFHGFCSRLLDGDDGRTNRRALLTPVRERLLWRRLVQSGALNFSSFAPAVAQSSQFATDCLNAIGQLKGQGIRPEDLATAVDSDERVRDLTEAYGRLDDERRTLGLRDYRDLVNEAERELSTPESSAARWLCEASFRHILVDEFQDSDRMQLRLLEAIRALISPQPQFCFVGDKNQSIYRFRGASPGNVDAARASFGCETLVLHDNRRSAQAILDVANADKHLDDQSKTKAADAGRSGAVRLARPRTVEDEVRFIRDGVAAKIAGGTAPGAVAVLLRQTRPYQHLVIDALREASIPVAAQPTAGFHEDALIDAVLTALRLLAAPADQMLWSRLLTNPIVGYRPIDVRYAFDAGRRAGISDVKAMLRINPPAGPQPIADFLCKWQHCVEAHGKLGPFDLAVAVVRELDLLRPVRENRAIEGFDPAASPLRLQALLDAAGDFDLEWIEDGSQGDAADQTRAPQRALSQNVSEFIARLDETIGLLADANQPPPAETLGVRVISIHAAKGLEFDFVVIPQALDDILPAGVRPNRLLPPRSVRSLRRAGAEIFVDDDEARSEEHSLWYVALTRARSEVLVTAARVDDEGVDLQLSPFAAAIPVAPDADAEFAADGKSGPCIEDSQRSGDAEASNPARSPAQPQPVPIVLPAERLSPTAIGEFVLCPRRFFYDQVLRLPRRDSLAALYGEKLHTILARFHEVETNFENVSDPEAAAERYAGVLRELTIEETGSIASEALAPLARFEREELERRLRLYACELAREAAAQPFSVAACEKSVAFSFGDLTIAGRVDRIDRLPDGKLIIRDYKSGRFRDSLVNAVRNALAQLDSGEELFGDSPKGLNLQVILYLPGVEEAFGATVCRLDYLYFRGKTGGDPFLVDRTTLSDARSNGDQARTLTREELARVRRDIADKIAQLCRSGSMAAFPTTRNEHECFFCDFVRICPGAGKIAFA